MSRERRSLRYLAGTYAGRMVRLRERLAIGRGHDNDLVLLDEDAPAASARHAEIRRQDAGYMIADLGSSNGTFVNGERVERTTLRPGDRIGFGGDPLLECVTPARRGRILLLLLPLFLLAAGFAFLRSGPATFERAARRAEGSVFYVVIDEAGRREGLGTAFAVASGVLATNAHVARAVERRLAVARVIRNDNPGESSRIAGVIVYPRFTPGSFRDDVAVLRLEPGPRLQTLRLAPDDEIRKLSRGTRVASLGFPAAHTDLVRPRARLREHTLGDVRDGRYFELGDGIAAGCSGSPVLNLAGEVVAMVVGGEDLPGESGGWAISVAAIREILP